MPNAVDVRLFIAEIHKRSALWDVRSADYKARHSQALLWKEVSEIIGMDVDQCKRKWKNLRDAYRAEVKRTERRIEGDKLLGAYACANNYKSKWAYFDAMSFVRFTQRHSLADVYHEDDLSNSNYPDKSLHDHNNHFYERDDNFSNIKSEPEHGEGIKRHHLDDDDDDDDDDEENNELDDDEANDLLFEEFQNIATPQAARRLSATLSLVNTEEHKSHLAQQQQQHTNDDDDDDTKNTSTSSAHGCKCSKRTDEQVHFLEDLSREEQKLITSTKQDITRTDKLDHIGDSDYNFLVSFLPQMKKMNELQNLQFRAKMCEMVLNIVAPSAAIIPPIANQQQAPALGCIGTTSPTPAVTLQTETDFNAATSSIDTNNLI